MGINQPETSEVLVQPSKYLMYLFFESLFFDFEGTRSKAMINPSDSGDPLTTHLGPQSS